MRVELLFADGDPAAMPARQNLVEVLTEDAFETPIQMVAVASEDDAELARDARIAHRSGSTARTSSPAGIGPVGHRARETTATGPCRRQQLIRRAVERARGWGHAPPR